MDNTNNTSKFIITTKDFQDKGRLSLNLSEFTNLEKGISPVDFSHKYQKDNTHQIYKAEDVAKFITDVNDEINNQLEKAVGTEEVNLEELKERFIEKAKSDIGELKRVEVLDDEGEKTVYFVKAIAEDGGSELVK